jgi:hypothetical protein
MEDGRLNITEKCRPHCLGNGFAIPEFLAQPVDERPRRTRQWTIFAGKREHLRPEIGNDQPVTKASIDCSKRLAHHERRASFAKVAGIAFAKAC